MVLEHKEEDVRVHRGLPGWREVDPTQLHHLQRRSAEQLLQSHSGNILSTVAHCFSSGFKIVIVFFPGNHKLTATAKVIVKICEHEVFIRLCLCIVQK